VPETGDATKIVVLTQEYYDSPVDLGVAMGSNGIVLGDEL
jgi:hypothetical protein